MDLYTHALKAREPSKDWTSLAVTTEPQFWLLLSTRFEWIEASDEDIRTYLLFVWWATQ